MQDIKIVRYARVGWNTRVIRAEARKEVAKVLDSMP
jgi:hypothetical protein